MDEIDRLLTKLAEEDLPGGLTQRIQKDFQKRYYRRFTLKLTISGLMVAAGTWLFIPWIVAAASQINWFASGLPVLQTLATVNDPGGVVNTTWQGASLMQANLSGSIGLDQWLGLMSLGSGAWLGLSVLLPGKTG